MTAEQFTRALLILAVLALPILLAVISCSSKLRKKATAAWIVDIIVIVVTSVCYFDNPSVDGYPMALFMAYYLSFGTVIAGMIGLGKVMAEN